MIDSDEEDSGEVAEHDAAVIDVSRFSVDSDMGVDTTNPDASVDISDGDIGTSEPGDVIVNVPELEGSDIEDSAAVPLPDVLIEDLAEQMDEVELGTVNTLPRSSADMRFFNINLTRLFWFSASDN